ncbi:hypothetical protein [Deinococcus navajonensis]|uniref:Intracellular proteinase inhibitor BsuPI domain-containing protein n=1 Tax=Deinococcus navajonensis TaxID=309884 RepID=A0ABV8XJM1_9DEIO
MTLRVLLLLALAGTALAFKPRASFSAVLSVPPHLRAGPVPVSVNVMNHTGQDVTLSLPRDSRQFCAAAPHIRILRVGTREVVYPLAYTDRMCTMDMVSTVLKAGTVVPFTRSVTLPKGHYLIEAWIPGVNGQKLRTPYRVFKVQ